MIFENNHIYEGDWENDFKHGHGYEKFPNSSYFIG